MPRSVQILAFDAMEVLDYAGPYEVFNVAGERTDPRAFTVSSVGVSTNPVGRGGFTIVPDYTLEDAPSADILVVPGGAGTRALVNDVRLINWLRERGSATELVMTVCTGSILAGAAGLLDGLPATTHHAALKELAEVSPRISVIEGRRFVMSSDTIRTSAGVSAGTDLALAIVEELEGVDVRAAVENVMEWMWPDGHVG